MQEQEVNHLARLLITELCLRGSNSLPSVDRLTDDAVHRLRECRPCLVHRNIQKAYGRFIVWLPAYAANMQSADFVSPDAGEQPHQRHSSDHLNRVVSVYPPARVSPTHKVFWRDVQPSPQKPRFDGMLPAVDAKRMAREAKPAKQITLDQDSGNGGWVMAGSRFAPRARQSLAYRLLPEPGQCSKFPIDSTVL